MRNHDAKIQASEGVKSWINSSKSIDTLFERVVASCANNRLALKGKQEPAPVSKTSYSTQDISRVEQASDWVRKYLSWREDRKALGFPAGTRRFWISWVNPFFYWTTREADYGPLGANSRRPRRFVTG